MTPKAHLILRLVAVAALVVAAVWPKGTEASRRAKLAPTMTSTAATESTLATLAVR